IIENEIVGIASITSVQKERMKHNGTLGISLRKKYWGIGLGSEIMVYLIDWAKSNKITKKINLLVREDNIRGVKLYEKFGFEKEGLLKKDICVNGIYYNTIAMGLYID
ncbi:MAG: GNAT family N-acetyltransferase, partial [Paraclostridium bifermentans]